MDIGDLEDFIVAAKAASYIGGGQPAEPSRPGAHDLTYALGAWRYRDSYFGGTDFPGQEVVWLAEEPVWAMNYFGYILRPDLFDGARAGETVKAALAAMYAEGRFLGGFSWQGPHGLYRDESSGDVTRFHGREVIIAGGVDVYALDYCGGLIKP
ncbi:DUF5680 domain-containing protein [Pelagibacterium limicola]|uniref:DUF5680 domain-containing protein n=1 Tax=Pelagibacterium limicola TaxID=2791022 RepID=UPI0018AF9598|nr:DUF5680 domain-containing protein [Pelagibacterium limicola]